MMKHIYEHLKTKKKYNTLELKYNVKCEELEEKIVELNTERRTRRIEKQKFEEQIAKLVEENIKLKQKKKGGNKNGKELLQNERKGA